MEFSDFCNGYLQHENGRYTGRLSIEGIDISPISGVYFKTEDLGVCLWLKRQPILEYDEQTNKYREREREPRWEAYLKKQVKDSVVAYKGEFAFMHFMFSITGVWDKVLGTKQRLNLYIERMPMSKQSIINGINKRKNEE